MLSVLLIGVSLSMDAFAVSVTNGLTIRDFRPRHGLWMGLYFGLFQCLMPLAGYFLGSTVSGYVSALGPYVSFLLLAFIGGKMVRESLQEGDAAGMMHLSHRRLLALAFATSIDALAVGVSFAFSPPAMGTPAACLLIGLCTFCLSFAGAMAGSRVSGLQPKKAELAGGCVLIAIGLKLLLEGLLG